MANAEVGTAYVSVTPSMKGFSKAVKAEAETASKGASGALSKVGTAAAAAAKVATAAFAAVAAAVGAVSKASLDSYANFEQLAGGVQKLYGDAADAVMENAANAYKTAGMSANQYMEQATSFSAALVQSLGGDTAKAAEMTDVAMRAMADNVSVFGSNMEDVQNAFQGFAKQNYTMLDNLKLGYGGTKEEMERLISDAEAYAAAQGKACDLSIDSFADVVTAIQLVQEQQGIAGTTAAEAAATIEGSVAMAKGAWDNFLTGLANPDADMDKLTDELSEAIGLVATNVIPRLGIIVGRLVESLPKVIGEAAAKIPEVAGPLLEQAMQSVADGCTGMLAAIGIKAPPIDVSTAIKQAAQQIQGFAGTFSGIFDSVVAPLRPVAEELIGFAVDAAGRIGQLFTDAKGSVDVFMAAAGEPLQGVFGAIANAVAPVFDGVTRVYDSLMAVARDVAPQLAEFAGQVTATIGPTLESVFGTIGGIAKSAFDGISTAVQHMQPIVQAAMDVLSTVVLPAFQAAWEVLQPVVEGVLGGIQTAVDTVMAAVTQIIDIATAAIHGDWDAVWTGIGSLFDTVVGGIKSTAESIFGGLMGTCETIWNGIKSAIEGPINTARDVVGSAIDAIVGFFDFDISWPHIPMPHFSISPSGWQIGDLLQGSIPSLGISWYAKGGIVDGAQLIGAGEAGPEAIMPLSGHYMLPFARAVAAEMGDMGGSGGNTFGNVYVTIDGGSPEDVFDQLMRGIERAKRQYAGRW